MKNIKRTIVNVGLMMLNIKIFGIVLAIYIKTLILEIMKKLLLIIALTLLGCVLMAQKKTNYEKYREREDSIANAQLVPNKDTTELDDLYYQPIKDGKKDKRNHKQDTVENQVVVINNYYDEDPFYYSNNIGRFNHGGFNYWMYDNPYYYSSWGFGFGWGFNSWYNPWFYDNFYYGYSPYYYSPYYYAPYYYGNNHTPYYGNNHYNNRPGGYAFLGSKHYVPQPSASARYNDGMKRKQNPNAGRFTTPFVANRNSVDRNVASKSTQNRPVANRSAQNPQQKSEYAKSNRSYTPSYQSPRMSTRPQFNNSRSGSPMQEGKGNMNQQRSAQPRSFTNPNSGQQRGQSVAPPNPTPRNQGRSYSTPSRSSSPSYSAPQRSQPSSGSNFSRSSGSSYSGGGSSSSGSYSGGGASRSSGGSSSGSISGGGSTGRR